MHTCIIWKSIIGHIATTISGKAQHLLAPSLYFHSMRFAAGAWARALE